MSDCVFEELFRKAVKLGWKVAAPRRALWWSERETEDGR
jgi:hypothetical protein